MNTPHIESCFSFIKGIGTKALEKLDQHGFKTWEDALQNEEHLPFSVNQNEIIIDSIQSAKTLLEENKIATLISQFPNKEHWRFLKDFENDLSYFDIETTGLSIYEDEPTVVVCHHKGKLLTFINGDNLNDFIDILCEIKLLVSFNGASFDVPFIQEYFNIPTLPCPHIDLRWVCHHKGLTGGLKLIEKEVGVFRDASIGDIDGREAVFLWHKYKRYHISNALTKLIEYCQADVTALVQLGQEIQYR